MPTAFEHELRTAESIAAQAAALLLGGWGTRPTVHFKSEVDLVTEFDKRAETLIVGQLAAAFPDDTIIAEEGAERRGASGRVWFVDPLDGTTNFSHGLPFFCVSIGLCVDGDPQVGAINAPALAWRFSGCVARGEARGEARWNGKPMVPSPIDSLNRSLLVTGFPYVRDPKVSNFPEFERMTALSQGVRRMGSAALDLCFVGCGWLEAYWEAQLKPWDLAAGAAILTAAGGKVTALDGTRFVPETGAVLATNGRVHDEMVTALRTLWNETGGGPPAQGS